MACAAARSPADQDRFICIYPAYLNNKKTIAEGRRIPISKAVENPTATEIQDVCAAVGLNVFLEKNKMYSREWNRDLQYRGRVRVQLKQEDGSLCLVQFPSRSQVLLTGCSSSLSATPDAMGAWSVAGSHMSKNQKRANASLPQDLKLLELRYRLLALEIRVNLRVESPLKKNPTQEKARVKKKLRSTGNLKIQGKIVHRGKSAGSGKQRRSSGGPRRPVITDEGDGGCQGAEYHLKARGKNSDEGKMVAPRFLLPVGSSSATQVQDFENQVFSLCPPRIDSSEDGYHSVLLCPATSPLVSAEAAGSLLTLDLHDPQAAVNSYDLTALTHKDPHPSPSERPEMNTVQRAPLKASLSTNVPMPAMAPSPCWRSGPPTPCLQNYRLPETAGAVTSAHPAAAPALHETLVPLLSLFRTHLVSLHGC
ncbi:PREDICTED: uncharacterized protein LOC105002773 [Bison bison bison]|uniref:Signal recognition particle 19 kDa protein n=1 Tax=Bison bison bison TaxID=43346 RepID=A0A6P3J3G4_BISBB|nr:PREDICTED: uncharacterized protein LOC105002773 [Bison bison bison]